ncbi:hypothetical protein KR222_010093 [Zaprionus bogoriensis]|nr:hypothetical protein KR222_010093 [Zaprionus bogoriensis]
MSEKNALTQSNSMETFIGSIRSARARHRLQMYLKLINLYREHECLWMENHENFCNFQLKESVWLQIAETMATSQRPEPDPDKWKRKIHKLFYNVHMQQLHEHEARHLQLMKEELPPKLWYSDKLQFIFKHRFDRRSHSVEAKPVRPAILKTSESLATRCMRLGRDKARHGVSFSRKLQALETLRNRRRGMLILTPEAYSELARKL